MATVATIQWLSAKQIVVKAVIKAAKMLAKAKEVKTPAAWAMQIPSPHAPMEKGTAARIMTKVQKDQKALSNLLHMGETC